MKYLLLVISTLSFFSCQNPRAENLVIREELPDTPYFEPGYRYVQFVADSLRTPEDMQLIEKLKELPKHLKVDNNKVTLALSREEFLAMGIPEQYYILMEKDIVNINKMFKENNETNVDSIFKVSSKDTLKN